MSAGAIQAHSLEEPDTEPPQMIPVPDLAELYGQNVRYVWRCLRSLGVRDRELEDAIQDLFMVVQKKLPDFDGRVSARTWLYAIAIRIARRYKERHGRAAARFCPEEEHAETLASPHNTEAEFVYNERLACAREALNALDDDKREVFVLAQIEQMSAKEIGEITGVPMNTVYSRLRAAKAAFSEAIQRLEARSRRSR
ncbi:MAG: sigma-70 family RNA polymerase sigma factor [Polyangiaceae bacterium]